MERTAKQFRKRNAILACVRGTDTHPSAEWVYGQLKPEYPDISLGTVYRNLSLFKQQGLIVSIGTVNGVERFDGNIDPHVHLICTGCDGVTDLPQLAVPTSLSGEAAVLTGAKINTCHLSFTGVCARCQSEN